MGAGILFGDDGETTIRPEKEDFLEQARARLLEKEDFLEQARARLLGRKLVGLESRTAKAPGRDGEVEAFLIQFEGNEELILFAPMAYGLSQSKQILGGQG